MVSPCRLLKFSSYFLSSPRDLTGGIVGCQKCWDSRRAGTLRTDGLLADEHGGSAPGKQVVRQWSEQAGRKPRRRDFENICFWLLHSDDLNVAAKKFQPGQWTTAQKSSPSHSAGDIWTAESWRSREMCTCHRSPVPAAKEIGRSMETATVELITPANWKEPGKVYYARSAAVMNFSF
jgi:hypothetical protein